MTPYLFLIESPKDGSFVAFASTAKGATVIQNLLWGDGIDTYIRKL